MINKCLKACFKMLNKSKEDVPVAAVLIKDNKIISKAYNTRNKKNNIIGHAEINCILKAGKRLKRWNLNDCSLIVTLKPCKMCEEIIKEARIENVYYLLDKPDYKKPFKKTKIMKLDSNSKVEKEYLKKLQSFFENKR